MASPNYTFNLHPHRIFTLLIIAGLTILFLSFTTAYGYATFKNQIPALRVPLIFFFNTFVIIGSSITISRAKRAFREDNYKLLRRNLSLTIWITLLFLIGQVFGWRAIFLREIPWEESVAVSYVYVISGLHVLHILAGIPFLLHFYICAEKLKGSVNKLIFFTNPGKKLRLNLLATYWYFLDLVWLYLITFFAGYYFL